MSGSFTGRFGDSYPSIHPSIHPSNHPSIHVSIIKWLRENLPSVRYFAKHQGGAASASLVERSKDLHFGPSDTTSVDLLPDGLLWKLFLCIRKTLFL